jgi:HD-like signal output (HDOD) protein
MSNSNGTEHVKQLFEECLERKDLKLPLLPRVAAMVIQLATDEDADAQQLSKLIQSDQALAGHVMRIANSPAYRPVSAFVSLQQAIARLGIVIIGEIAIATSLNSDLFSAKGNEKLIKKFWYQSLCCSAWSREIARMRRTNVESSFLAGLLCQIGKPVVVQGIDEFGLETCEVEKLVSQYYVRAGALLANDWDLPEVVGHVIIHHQEMEDSGTFDDDVLNVQAALCMTVREDEDNLPAELLERLNFYPEDIETLNAKQEVVSAWVDSMGVS